VCLRPGAEPLAASHAEPAGLALGPALAFTLRGVRGAGGTSAFAALGLGFTAYRAHAMRYGFGAPRSIVGCGAHYSSSTISHDAQEEQKSRSILDPS